MFLYMFLYNDFSNYQSVITTRIYVLHKITIPLKFMSYINSDLLILVKKLQTPGQPQSGINGLEVGSQQCDDRDPLMPNQEHIAAYIFSNLGTHVPFLKLQGYISLQQASDFDSSLATQFLWITTVGIAKGTYSYSYTQLAFTASDQPLASYH